MAIFTVRRDGGTVGRCWRIRREFRAGNSARSSGGRRPTGQLSCFGILKGDACSKDRCPLYLQLDSCWRFRLVVFDEGHHFLDAGVDGENGVRKIGFFWILIQ